MTSVKVPPRSIQNCQPASASDDVRAAVERAAGAPTVEKILALPVVRVVPAVRQPGRDEIARQCLAEEFRKLSAKRGQAREIAEAVEDVAHVEDEGLTWRLKKAAESVDRAGRGDTEDRAQYDTGDNGARMLRDERDAFEDLLGSIDFEKKPSRPM